MKIIKTLLMQTKIKKDMQLLQQFALDANIVHHIEYQLNGEWDITLFVYDRQRINLIGIKLPERDIFLDTMLKEEYSYIRNILSAALFDEGINEQMLPPGIIEEEL